MDGTACIQAENRFPTFRRGTIRRIPVPCSTNFDAFLRVADHGCDSYGCFGNRPDCESVNHGSRSPDPCPAIHRNVDARGAMMSPLPPSGGRVDPFPGACSALPTSMFNAKWDSCGFTVPATVVANRLSTGFPRSVHVTVYGLWALARSTCGFAAAANCSKRSDSTLRPPELLHDRPDAPGIDLSPGPLHWERLSAPPEFPDAVLRVCVPALRVRNPDGSALVVVVPSKGDQEEEARDSPGRSVGPEHRRARTTSDTARRRPRPNVPR